MRYSILFLLLVCFSCTKDSYEPVVSEDPQILKIKWNKAYEDDTVEKSVLALRWAFSSIGASLPKDNLTSIQTNEKIISVEVNKLGFTDHAEKVLLKLHDRIKKSEEYKLNETIDLGRYVTLLIGASEHYYDFVETPKKLSDLLSKYELKDEKGYINNSVISYNHRIVEYSEQKEFQQFFISTEIDPSTKEILEYETIELLPNGQLRFGIYDVNGNRINAVKKEKNTGNKITKRNKVYDDEHKGAGKPAKCMWCHESRIQIMFSIQDDFEGYLSYSKLQETLLGYRVAHEKQQEELLDGVTYIKRQDHTFMEIMYISFMEPSAERLSEEWNLSISEVKKRLESLQTHKHKEFSFLGDLYDRNEIESFAPFTALEVSSRVREFSENEVNHIDF